MDRKVFAFLLCFSLYSCESTRSDSSDEVKLLTSEMAEDFKQQAQESLNPLKKNLMATLMRELEKSAAHAVKACQLEAPMISERAEQETRVVKINEKEYSIKLGRTSHRVRNQDNLPAKWVQTYLDSFKGRKDINNQEEIIVVKLDQGSFGYLEPISLGPMCMTCHGGDIDEDLYDVILSQYPDDRAIDFDLGEFRGFFWVEFHETRP